MHPDAIGFAGGDVIRHPRAALQNLVVFYKPCRYHSNRMKRLTPFLSFQLLIAVTNLPVPVYEQAKRCALDKA